MPPSAIARFRASRRRRGAAVLMVVLILTMLMGVGVYAARYRDALERAKTLRSILDRGQLQTPEEQ
jgi:Flp pilus assembly protein TadG